MAGDNISAIHTFHAIILGWCWNYLSAAGIS